MDDLRDFYLRKLEGRIEALELARGELARDPGRARESIGLIAHSLRGSGATYGFPDISAAAAAVEEAPADDIGPLLDGLLATLRRVRGEGGPAKRVVLILEDDPVGASVMAALLAAPDREVLVAGDGAGARALLSSRKVDLLLLDLVLPDQDGRAFLMALRENPATAALPVLVLSGKLGELTRRECLSLGADAFFEKPFDHAALAAAAATALAPDDGTRPAAVPADWSRAPAEAPAAGSVRPVLVADDDPQIARIIAHRLGKEGFVARCFGDGESALAAARAGGFALAILDVKMPMMDGFELLGRIRELPGERLPVLMLTSLGKEQDVVRGFDLGADDYLTKPFSPAELLARVRHLLGTRGRA